MTSFFANFRYLLIVLLLGNTCAYGSSFISHSSLYRQAERLMIDIDTRIDFPQAVEEAIHSGLTLTFQYQFEIKSNKWYTFGTLNRIDKTYLLSYHRLTGKYYLTDPKTAKQQRFSSLYAVKQAMQQLRGFPLLSINQLPKAQSFVRFRFHLSDNNLPSMVWIERLFNNNWSVDSQWHKQVIP